MALDAVAIRALTVELGALEGFKIDKLYQPERNILVLSLRASGSVRKLLISADSSNPRVHLTDEKYENPAAPPMFCMLLRKRLAGGRITAIKQLGFERIIDIEVESRTELGDTASAHLMCEIMGRNSNIIFLNDEMKIIDSIKHVDITVSSVRNILPGLKYVMPPAPRRLEPLEASSADFLKILNDAEDGIAADKAIPAAVAGISPLLARECVYVAGGDGNMKIGEMSANVKQKTAIALEKMFSRVKSNDFSPCILLKDDGSPAEFAPFPIKQYGDMQKVRPTQSMNSAAEEFYRLRDRAARIKSHSAAVQKTVNNNISRASKKLNLLQSDLKAAADRDKYRIYGDLITANLYKINKGDRSVTVENYYDESSGEITIPLDETKSPSQNAKFYYNKYKKAKNTEIYAAEQLEATLKELEYLESVQLALENVRTPGELGEIRSELEREGYIKAPKEKKPRKPAPASAPMEFFHKGYTILVGRNNVQNDYLTLKIGRSKDLWLHTKNIAGSHTLVKYNGEDFPADVITVAAGLAAHFSKAANAPKAEVDYCPVSHVKKPNGAKAGMVVYEGYSTALVEPLSPEKLDGTKE